MIANDTADIITSLAILVGALVAGLFVIKGIPLAKSLQVKFGKIEATLDTVHDSVNGVDKANDEPVLIQKVRNLGQSHEEMATRMVCIEADVVEVKERVACFEGKLDGHIEQTAANMTELKEAMQSHIESNAEWQTFVKGQLQVLIGIAGAGGAS